MTRTTSLAKTLSSSRRHSLECRALRDYLDLRGFYYHKHLGSVGQRPGLPDFDVVIGGRYIAVEVKTGNGRLSRAQQAEREAIERAGGIYLAGDVETIVAQLENIRKQMYNESRGVR